MIDLDTSAAILDATGATKMARVEVVQQLWSGYGHIWRCHLAGGRWGDGNAGGGDRTVIVKHVAARGNRQQPRGWNTDTSHARKLRSYEVEQVWYRDYAGRLDADCRVASCHATRPLETGSLFVLEDLDAVGFDRRASQLRPDQVLVCVRWLARFHARFLGVEPEGLWPDGTYWHLATRQDEWSAMRPNDPLRQHAAAIDGLLRECPYQTIVHGDAKVANFCFRPDLSDVAAVDFQYVGGGCGMKDLVYFLGSCLTENECDRHAETALEAYFAELRYRLPPGRDGAAIEREWRRLYPVAWADFNRFLTGWYPQHHKLHRYSQRMTDAALAEIG